MAKKRTLPSDGDFVASAPPSKRAMRKKQEEKMRLKEEKKAKKEGEKAKIEPQPSDEEEMSKPQPSDEEERSEPQPSDEEERSEPQPSDGEERSEPQPSDGEEGSDDTKESGAWAPFKKKKKEVNPRLQGVWTNEEIEFSLKEIKEQLAAHDAEMEKKIAGQEYDESKLFSSPAKRKKKDRAKRLEDALNGGAPIGGQLIPKKKGKTVRMAERSRVRQEERKGRATQGVDGTVDSSAKDNPCYHCGKMGHIQINCPDRGSRPIGVDVCYNCGKKGHTLKACPDRRSSSGPLKYVTCYICKEQGHLSSECVQGPGKYPKGGECHHCGSKFHLMRDCPEKNAVLDKQDARLSAFNSSNRGGRGAGRGGGRGGGFAGRGGRGGGHAGRGRGR